MRCMAHTVITVPADVVLGLPAADPVAVTGLLAGRLLVVQAGWVLS